MPSEKVYRIKPLEWTWNDDTQTWLACPILGVKYRAYENNQGGATCDFNLAVNDSPLVCRLGTIDAAKLAATAHWERRIAGALIEVEGDK